MHLGSPFVSGLWVVDISPLRERINTKHISKEKGTSTA